MDRQILGNDPLNKISLDSINAFDALLFTRQSDPNTAVPTIFEELKALFAPVDHIISTWAIQGPNTSSRAIQGPNTSSQAIQGA